jgi:hypothetical protein
VCDSTSTVCYSHSTTTANFTGARDACAAIGGDLVHYQNGAEQMFVEAHMAKGGSLALTYWVRASPCTWSSKQMLPCHAAGRRARRIVVLLLARQR